MIYPALNDEATAAAADAIRAWSDVIASWSAIAVAPASGNALERWSALLTAGMRAQEASLRAGALAAPGVRLATTPFGLTGLFAAAPPPKAPAKPRAAKGAAKKRSKTKAKAAAKAAHGGYQALAKPLGRADDLVRIKGVGPKMQEKLNKLGVFHFWQIASWHKADVERLDAELGAGGRIARDDWVGQAKRLAEDVAA